MRKDPEPVRRWTWPHYYFVGCLIRFWLRLAGGFSIRGREHLPAKGGALVCSNHVSYLDPPVLGTAIMPRRTYYFAKIELFKNPLFAFIIRKSYAFPVDREGTDREAIRNAVDVLNKGELLVLFPEGGRSLDGSLQPGNLGPALIASKAGVPIIPAALKDTERVLARGGKLHRGHVQVDFGEPIRLPDTGEGRLSKDQMQEITEQLMTAIYALQKQQYERAGEIAPPRVKEKTDAQ